MNSVWVPDQSLVFPVEPKYRDLSFSYTVGALTVPSSEASHRSTGTSTVHFSSSSFQPRPQGSSSNNSFALPPFRGLPSEDSATWLAYFNKTVRYHNMTIDQKLAFLPLLLRDVATELWDILPKDRRADWEQASAASVDRFVDNGSVRRQKAGEFWSRNQAPRKLVDKYVSALQNTAKPMGIGEDVVKYAFMRGLRSNLRSHVIRSNASTLEELIKAARLAEVAV